MCPEGNETKETVLRKYPNRRIYDPTKNAHVTLSEIADRVKNGEKIRVVDQKTGEDLTQIIMGQVLFETLKTRPDYLPLDLVLLMIRAHPGLSSRTVPMGTLNTVCITGRSEVTTTTSSSE